ncbi:MAG: BrnT family toxin [Deltaproteobacteria bacterium]|nr:BrnT family toxin [Deltaproteobacteria bacterium]
MDAARALSGFPRCLPGIRRPAGNPCESLRNQEERFVSTAEINGKLYTVVWTWRGKNQRIISFRRAGNGEERAYRKIHG